MTPEPSQAYASWGRLSRPRHFVFTPRCEDEVVAALAHRGIHSCLSYGLGRSYGDVALNPDGVLIDCRQLNNFIAFDRATGQLTCEAGVSLADILAVVSKTQSKEGAWFLPVSPGTRFVTVGGAIANDVHGKNHHIRGCFGSHVVQMRIARSDGQVINVSQAVNPELFAATIGGLGLTGVITQATLQLQRVPGLGLEIEEFRLATLDDFFALSTAEKSWEYTAAWIDCTAKAPYLGRGIFTRARHLASDVPLPAPPRKPSLGVPALLTLPAANSYTVHAFNWLYRRRLRGRGLKAGRGNYVPVLYPLDAIGHWNRLYGRPGFFQFQCVIPHAAARPVLHELLSEIGASKQGSILGVIKVFGDVPSPGLLSFPAPGVTLALDFPNRMQRTRTLLGRLEQIVVRADGRIYPAKDSLMSADTFTRGYPNVERFKASIDVGMSSAFARRVGLVAGQGNASREGG
jgi:FAD/FMN-containing dehydrogenase